MQILRGGRLFCFKRSAVPATKWFAEVRRGRSHAASLPSDTPKRKRLSKDERRAMVESFINRYRSMNAGKFPSVSEAQKEVGGSYYVVRKLVQELEYNSKVYFSNSSFENLSANSVNKEDKSFSEVEPVSTAASLQNVSCIEAVDDVKMLDSDEKQLEAEQVLQVYTSARETLSEASLKPQTPGSHGDFVLEETNVLKDDAKCLERLEDGIVEDAGVDSSDKFLRVPDKRKVVQVPDQHLASAEECKNESQFVQPHFGEVEDDLLKEEIEVGKKDGNKKEQTASKDLLDFGSPEVKAEHHQRSIEEEKQARYRSMNAGKFPSVSETQVYTSAGETLSEAGLKRQIPGSHGDFALEETNVLNDDAKCLEKLEDDEVVDVGVDRSDKFLRVPNKRTFVPVSDEQLASAEEFKTGSQTVQSHFGEVEGDLLKEEIEVGKEESDKKERTASEDLLDSASSELKAEHRQQFLEEEKHTRNFSSEQRDDAEHSKKSTLWGNLKSFADGIINIWRKL